MWYNGLDALRTMSAAGGHWGKGRMVIRTGQLLFICPRSEDNTICVALRATGEQNDEQKRIKNA